MFFKPRLAVVFVEYNPDRYAGAFDRLKSYIGSSSRGRVVFVVVNNRDEGADFKVVDDRTFYVQGNNTDREFSGWQKGVDFLLQRNIPFDVVLFVNEAFEAVQTSYLRSHSASWISLKARFCGSAFGAIDTLWEKTKIEGKSTRAWINTNCFFMPRSLLNKLRTIASLDDRSMDKYLPRDFPRTGELFHEDSPVNSVYREHLVSWLTEDWHGRLELDESTWPEFRAKTKAIFNEALLSIRIRELGRFILPYSLPRFISLKTGGLLRRFRKVLFGTPAHDIEKTELEGTERHGDITSNLQHRG